MKVDLAPGWTTELNRGPNWLFVRLYGPDGEQADATGIAESLSMLMKQELVQRLVLELDQLEQMPAEFVRELVELHEQLDQRGGIVRLCGVSDVHQDILRDNQIDHWFPQFGDREQAVKGSFRPSQPR